MLSSILCFSIVLLMFQNTLLRTKANQKKSHLEKIMAMIDPSPTLEEAGPLAQGLAHTGPVGRTAQRPGEQEEAFAWASLLA